RVFQGVDGGKPAWDLARSLVAALFQRVAVIAQHVEDPEDRSGSGDAPLHIAVAYIQELGTALETAAHILLRQGMGLDEAHHHEPGFGMDDLRRQAHLEGRAAGADLAVAEDMVARE